jgi:hypothetical protein
MDWLDVLKGDKRASVASYALMPSEMVRKTHSMLAMISIQNMHNKANSAVPKNAAHF